MAHKITLDEIKKKIKEFIKDRDWEKYHSPKNISMSIAIEAAELMEHFQWLTIGQSKRLLANKNKKDEKRKIPGPGKSEKGPGGSGGG